MRKIIFIFFGLTLVVFLGIIYIFSQNVNQSEKPKKLPKIVLPIAEFEKRITKKPFGIYITPQNSPVQPERFTGYHTGVDVEYEDITLPPKCRFLPLRMGS